MLDATEKNFLRQLRNLPPYFLNQIFLDSENKKASESSIFRAFEEAQAGFEPARTGVADHCLTTWLLRHFLKMYIKLSRNWRMW